MKERHKRSIVKAASWRVLATLITVTIVFIFTGEIVLSLSVGVVELTLKIIFYYAHERVWNRIDWGKFHK